MQTHVKGSSHVLPPERNQYIYRHVIMEIIKTYDVYHACQHGYIGEYGIVMAVSKWKLDVYYLKGLNNQFCIFVTIICLTFSSACSYYNIAG